MSATADKESENGLIALHDDLVRNPTDRRYAIVEFTVPQIVDNVGGDQVPRVQLTLIEPFAPGAQHDELISLLDAHYLARNQFSRGKEPSADSPLPGMDDDDAFDNAPAVPLPKDESNVSPIKKK